jgi:branched-subunit amino acid ABC-type transport system permease component
MSVFAHAIGFGLVTAAIVALAAVSVSLQVSVTNYINFAYGDFMTIGAYVAWTADAHGLNLALAVVLGCLATALLGVAANILAFRPLARRGMRPVTLLIAGVGLSFILQSGIVMIWGASPRRFTETLGRTITVGPFLLTAGDIVIIVLSAVLMILLHLTLQYTKAGKALRATSNNPDLAQACGIDSNRVINIVWFLGGILAAIAGVALTLEEGFLGPTTGFSELFIIFGAVVLGGIGRPYGAMLGALVIGLLTELSGAYIDAAYKSSIAFGFVVILLLFRPQGILRSAGKTS